MKIAAAFALVFVVGCVGSPDVLDVEDSDDVVEDTTTSQYNNPPAPSGPTGCEDIVKKVILPNGNAGYVHIPVACNPLWRDTGDPPDTEVDLPAEKVVRYDQQ